MSVRSRRIVLVGSEPKKGLRELDRKDVALTSIVFTQGNFGLYRGQARTQFTVDGQPVKEDVVNVGVRLLRAGATKEELDFFTKNATILSGLSHPHVLGVGGILSSAPRMLVHDDVSNSLSSYLLVLPVEGPLLRKCALEVALALQYIDKQKIVHGDIACRNVFITDNLTCKLGNFGLEKLASDGTPSGYYTAPWGEVVMQWAAPEAEAGGAARKRSSAEDAWGYGFFLYELFTQGCIPYGKDTWVDPSMYVATMREVQRGALLPQPEGCSDDLYDLMVDCWDLDPAVRPTPTRMQAMLSSREAVDELDSILGMVTAAIQSGFEMSQASPSPAPAPAPAKAAAAAAPATPQSKGGATPVAFATPSPGPGVGGLRAGSPEQNTHALVRENADLRRELEEMRNSLALLQAQQQQPEKKKKEKAPSSPRAGRKFHQNVDAGSIGRKHHGISDTVVQRFSSMFTDPSFSRSNSSTQNEGFPLSP